MRRLFFLFILLSCSDLDEIVEPMPQVETGHQEVDVHFSLNLPSHTKSSIMIDEHTVSDINLVAYRDGRLVEDCYLDDMTQELTLTLSGGYSYNVYALANVGRVEADIEEEVFCQHYAYSINSLSELEGTVPMSWKMSNLRVSNSMESVRVSLKRHLAKVGFAVDKELLENFNIESVCLRQGASVLRPFKDYSGGGSRAESTSEVMDGDYASVQDLRVLDDGGEICFYALENCQGILLPDNDDPMAKVPENIDEKQSLCTYLEVSGAFGNLGMIDGSVTYRMYLGLDACSSFDVVGNSDISIVLHLTDSGLREVSWRVDADVSLREGYAWGGVAEGLHPISDLYVGELFRYEYEISEEMLSYLDGNLEGCVLKMYDGNGPISSIEPVGYTFSGRSCSADMRCISPAQGYLALCAQDGEILSILEENVNVSLPSLRFSEYSNCGGEEVESLAYLPQCEINGSSQSCYMYLVDRSGNNMNSPLAYGFDESLFEVCPVGVETGYGVESAFDVSLVKLSDQPGDCIYEVKMSCINDGTDHDINYGLSQLYIYDESVSAIFEEPSYGIYGKCSYGADIAPVTLTLVDNGWAGFHTCQLSMIVDNPSNLPVEVQVWQLNDVNADWGAHQKTDEVISYVEETLDNTYLSYITGAKKDQGTDLYASVSSFISERSPEGSHATISGDELVYPLADIETTDIHTSIIYDEFGQNGMMHLVDATLCGAAFKKSDVSIVNRLSNGSALFNEIYFGDWNTKGVWLYTAGEPVYSPNVYMNNFPNITPVKLSAMLARYESAGLTDLRFWYESDQLFVGTSSSASITYGLSLTIRLKGTVYGYVETDPNGIWGPVQENHCSADFDYEISGVPIQNISQKTSADCGALKMAMDKIYAITYEDKVDGEKFMHSAHPVSMDCHVELIVEGPDTGELYPVKLVWRDSSINYYHPQDGVTYRCAMNFQTDLFNSVIVRKR